MPELPEVETVRRGLEEHVAGCRVLDLAIIGPRTVRRHDPNLIKLEVVGKKITGCSRYGKYLILGLDDNLCMVIHLRMTGRLQLITDVPDLHDRHMHAYFTLDNDTSLVFFDPRTFGEIFLSKLMTANNLPEEISSLGPDPIVSDSWKDYLSKTIPTKSIPLKTLLLDKVFDRLIGIMPASWHISSL